MEKRSSIKQTTNEEGKNTEGNRAELLPLRATLFVGSPGGPSHTVFWVLLGHRCGLHVL